MGKIVTIKQVVGISKKLRLRKKRIVLVGGCFDILHIGHITFLQKAKKLGDTLFVLLESDLKVSQLKGNNRPVNTQEERAKILKELRSVDYIIKLPYFKQDREYDDLVLKIKPDILATTKGDLQRKHKLRQANLAQGKVIDIIERISHASTSKLARQLYKESL